MNRRAILKALGLGAAAPIAAPTISVGAAASALGMSTAMNEPVGPDECCGASDFWNFWSSPAGRRLDAHGQAEYECMRGNPYPHMKSWGHGFRAMCREREIYIEKEYRDRMERDQTFRNRVLTALGMEATA